MGAPQAVCVRDYWINLPKIRINVLLSVLIGLTFPVISETSFKGYIMTGATCRAGDAHSSGTPDLHIFGVYEAEMHIPRGSRVSMFDLYNMKDVECSTSSSGLYRSQFMDIKRETGCPYQVWIFLKDGASTRYTIRLDASTVTATLRSWMKQTPTSFKYSPINAQQAVLDTAQEDYDFLFYEDSETSIRAAVYNKRDDVTRPRFFYTGTTPPQPFLGMSRTALLESLANPDTSTTFNEANTLVLRFVYYDYCNQNISARYYNTCSEALDTEFCPCDCDYYDKMKYWRENAIPEDLTEDEIRELVRPEIEATKKQLTVNKTELSSFKNKKISASDHRTSAQGLGLLGAGMLATVFGSFVLCDLLSVKKHIRNIKHNCSCATN